MMLAHSNQIIRRRFTTLPVLHTMVELRVLRRHRAMSAATRPITRLNKRPLCRGRHIAFHAVGTELTLNNLQIRVVQRDHTVFGKIRHGFTFRLEHVDHHGRGRAVQDEVDHGLGKRAIIRLRVLSNVLMDSLGIDPIHPHVKE